MQLKTVYWHNKKKQLLLLLLDYTWIVSIERQNINKKKRKTMKDFVGIHYMLFKQNNI